MFPDLIELQSIFFNSFITRLTHITMLQEWFERSDYFKNKYHDLTFTTKSKWQTIHSSTYNLEKLNSNDRH